MPFNPDVYTRTDSAKILRLKAKFEQFVTDRGGEVLAPTSEWELIRFKANGRTAIIYRKANEQITFSGGAKMAFDAFLRQKSWSAGNTTKRKKGSKSVVIQSLIRRDGRQCFYCSLDTSDDDASVEHVVSLNAGGTDHMANKVLAHRVCNSEAGHLSVMEKVRLREAKRGIATPSLLQSALTARDALSTAIKAAWEGATDEDVADHPVIRKLDFAIAQATGQEVQS